MITKGSTKLIPAKNVIQGMNNAANNTAVTITVAAVPERIHVLHKVVWSYNNTAVGGLYVQNGAGNNVFEVDIIAGGPGGIDLNMDMSQNTAMIVTLKAGGTSVTGRLNIEYSTEA